MPYFYALGIHMLKTRPDLWQLGALYQHGLTLFPAWYTKIMKWGVELLICSSISTLHHWSLGGDKQFNLTLYIGCCDLSMLGLKSIHVSQRRSWWLFSMCTATLMAICHSHFDITDPWGTVTLARCIPFPYLTGFYLSSLEHIITDVGMRHKCYIVWHIVWFNEFVYVSLATVCLEDLDLEEIDIYNEPNTSKIYLNDMFIGWGLPFYCHFASSYMSYCVSLILIVRLGIETTHDSVESLRGMITIIHNLIVRTHSNIHIYDIDSTSFHSGIIEYSHDMSHTAFNI